MKTCDLHTHSVFSDGTWTPAQLIEEAERIGLGAIALSDHNTVAGLPDFMAAAEGKNVEAVPGIELSTDHHGTELHMLGLFIRPEYYGLISEEMEDYARRKDESNAALVDALRKAGYPLDYDAIKASTPKGQINRAHIGTELIRMGFADSMQDAFRRLLSERCGYYHPPKRMTPFEAIDLIRSIGAVPVLAHPLLTLTPERLRPFLEEAVPRGLAGMETRYVTYDPQTALTALHMAEAFSLKQSGGSDFHGGNKPDIRLGVGKGNLEIPMAFLEKLREN